MEKAVAVEASTDAAEIVGLRMARKVWSRMSDGRLLGLGFIVWHLLLIQRVTGNADQWVLSAMFWGAIAYQAMHLPRRERVRGWSRFLGWFLVGGLAIASFQLPINSAFVRVFPGWVAIAWVLLTVGWPTRRLWRPFLLVLALMIPPRLLPLLVQPWLDDICTLTAQTAAFGLHLVGFSVVQQGPFIQLPQGVVEVREGCTGVALAGTLLQLMVGMVALFPGIPVRKLIVESGAIAFFLSSLRVALMAAVVNRPDAFDYWHGNPGNQLFTLLAFLLFGLLIMHHEPN